MIRRLNIGILGAVMVLTGGFCGCKNPDRGTDAIDTPPEAGIAPDTLRDTDEGVAIDENFAIDEDFTIDEGGAAIEGDIAVEDGFAIEVIDSVTAARMSGRSYHQWSPVGLDQLRLIRILHYDAEGEEHKGVMVCHQQIAQDLLDIFRELYDARYPIERVGLIDDYEGDDETSMTANNSSAYNCRRTTGGGRLSRHAYGMAVDINPLYNPYIRTKAYGERVIAPAAGAEYCDRSLTHPYMIKRGDACHRAFVARGFRWGGDWRSSKDYQHFERR